MVGVRSFDLLIVFKCISRDTMNVEVFRSNQLLIIAPPSFVESVTDIIMALTANGFESENMLLYSSNTCGRPRQKNEMSSSDESLLESHSSLNQLSLA